MARIEIGIRELKARLSHYLARVARGDEVIVTRRGRPVARLVGAGRDELLDDLIAIGLVERAPARSRRPIPRPVVRLRGRGPSMAEYVRRSRR
jgi:prevent-host-death family protein